ncbi:hypothetical protein HUJ05_000577 [Dendroctonus ponderosae]|nr:hypothetical protein HUJ05_000577 [Dendroctonus ponderosae]
MLQKTYLGAKYQLHESFMCAGGEAGKDACRGDGGSPLVCATAPNETALYQAGIVAFGVGCGKEGIPGVYADATHFYQWIKPAYPNAVQSSLFLTSWAINSAMDMQLVAAGLGVNFKLTTRCLTPVPLNISKTKSSTKLPSRFTSWH